MNTPSVPETIICSTHVRSFLPRFLGGVGLKWLCDDRILRSHQYLCYTEIKTIYFASSKKSAFILQLISYSCQYTGKAACFWHWKQSFCVSQVKVWRYCLNIFTYLKLFSKILVFFLEVNPKTRLFKILLSANFVWHKLFFSLFISKNSRYYSSRPLCQRLLFWKSERGRSTCIQINEVSGTVQGATISTTYLGYWSRHRWTLSLCQLCLGTERNKKRLLLTGTDSGV